MDKRKISLIEKRGSCVHTTHASTSAELIEHALTYHEAWKEPIESDWILACFEMFDELDPGDRQRILTLKAVDHHTIAEHWSDALKQLNNWNVLVNQLLDDDTRQSTLDTLMDMWSCLPEEKRQDAQHLNDLLNVSQTMAPSAPPIPIEHRELTQEDINAIEAFSVDNRSSEPSAPPAPLEHRDLTQEDIDAIEAEELVLSKGPGFFRQKPEGHTSIAEDELAKSKTKKTLW